LVRSAMRLGGPSSVANPSSSALYRCERLDGGSRLKPEDRDAFAIFFSDVEPRLRRAFVAAYGPERGSEAVSEALAYAWEHWTKVRSLQNAAGYLYRVGQSRTRPRLRPRAPRFPPPTEDRWFEPELPNALASLTSKQRLSVVLIEGYGWTLTELSQLTGTSVSTIKRHLDRGMAKLRQQLEVREDA
jgi:DNA-directed RNA polymerase specialized sigma24 family protein